MGQDALGDVRGPFATLAAERLTAPGDDPGDLHLAIAGHGDGAAAVARAGPGLGGRRVLRAEVAAGMEQLLGIDPAAIAGLLGGLERVVGLFAVGVDRADADRRRRLA